MSFITGGGAIRGGVGSPTSYLLHHGPSDAVEYATYALAYAAAAVGDTLQLKSSIIPGFAIDKNIAVVGSPGTTITTAVTLTAGGLHDCVMMVPLAGNAVSWLGVTAADVGRITDIKFIGLGSGVGVSVGGSTVAVSIKRCDLASGTVANLVASSSGSNPRISDCTAHEDAICTGAVFSVNGTGRIRGCVSNSTTPSAYLIFGDIHVQACCSNNSTTAITRIAAGAVVKMTDPCFESAPYAIELAGACTLSVNGGTLSGTTASMQVKTAANASVVSLDTKHNGIEADPVFFEGSNYYSLTFATIAGDVGLSGDCQGAFGSHYRGRELVVGGGDSHVRQMVALTNTNLEVGTWANITTAAASDSGSTVDVFPGITAANCFYVGGDRIFPGNKWKTAAVIALGSGSIILERWDGSNWVETHSMATKSSGDLDHRGETPFANVESSQCRHGEWADMALKTLDGHTCYWVRWRIVADITTSPILEQIKLHTHRWEANADGKNELYGDGETWRPLPGTHIRDFSAMSGASPGSATITAATGMTFALAFSFPDNKSDGIGVWPVIPDWMDTSRLLRVRLTFTPVNTATGNIVFDVKRHISSNGDVLDGSATPLAVQSLTAVAGTAYKQYHAVLYGSVHDASPGDTLWWSLTRDSTATPAGPLLDTYAGAVTLTNIEFEGIAWQ